MVDKSVDRVDKGRERLRERGVEEYFWMKI